MTIAQDVASLITQAQNQFELARQAVLAGTPFVAVGHWEEGVALLGTARFQLNRLTADKST